MEITKKEKNYENEKILISRAGIALTDRRRSDENQRKKTNWGDLRINEI